ncbi:hypothetical protein [Sporosarcina sp.]|uniref:hypothetical protein n=1 Tax=Sporosarcina sp. TaxID=49982 RepID=UPI002603E0DD|nr:hypothetical protein [Sporosarcina sp.]
MTLYYFKKDTEGKRNCTGDCLANWPLVKDSDYEIPDGYDKADFGSIFQCFFDTFNLTLIVGKK